MKVALRDELVLTTRDGATFLTDLRAGEVYEMNGSAALILKALRDGDTLEGVTNALMREYPEVPVDELRADVKAMLDELRRQGFLREP